MLQIRTGDVVKQTLPHDHANHLCTVHGASSEVLNRAIESSLAAKREWEDMPWNDKAAIFLKAADLVAGKYRYELMAATMLGQGKNAWQAEIDTAAELADFFRFGVKYVEELYTQQPPRNSQGIWNRTEFRPLEGFVLAVAPFNFTAIGGNLVFAPVVVGNVCIWKPSAAAVYSNYLVHKILLEAGLPPSVIQFIPVSLRGLTMISGTYSCFTGSTPRNRSGMHQAPRIRLAALYRIDRRLQAAVEGHLQQP